MRKLRKASRYPSNARRTRRRRRGRQVALNWKSPKLEFSCQSWMLCLQGLFRRRSRLLPTTLPSCSSPLPPIARAIPRGTDKFMDVYTEITGGRRLRRRGGGRSIGCCKSDDERADSTFREARNTSAESRIGGCENDYAGLSTCNADEESNCRSIRRVKTHGFSNASLSGWSKSVKLSRMALAVKKRQIINTQSAFQVAARTSLYMQTVGPLWGLCRMQCYRMQCK